MVDLVVLDVVDSVFACRAFMGSSHRSSLALSVFKCEVFMRAIVGIVRLCRGMV